MHKKHIIKLQGNGFPQYTPEQRQMIIEHLNEHRNLARKELIINKQNNDNNRTTKKV